MFAKVYAFLGVCLLVHQIPIGNGLIRYRRTSFDFSAENAKDAQTDTSKTLSQGHVPSANATSSNSSTANSGFNFEMNKAPGSDVLPASGSIDDQTPSSNRSFDFSSNSGDSQNNQPSNGNTNFDFGNNVGDSNSDNTFNGGNTGNDANAPVSSVGDHDSGFPGVDFGTWDTNDDSTDGDNGDWVPWDGNDADHVPNTGNSAGGSGNKTFDFGNNNGGGDEKDAWEQGATVPSWEFPVIDLPDLNDGTESSENSESSVNATDNTDQVSSQSHTTLLPLEERMCGDQPHAVCLHGRCQESEYENGDSFVCVCLDGWIGNFCEQQCWLPCQHGLCKLRDPMMTSLMRQLTEEDLFCNCHHEWTGALCQDRKPDPEEEARILAAILASCLAVVLLLIILLPILLWRMRVIFVMKLVYFFQGYEDDDGKLYDAYVSMSPCTDAESFVYASMTPKLQELGFKLFIQARDLPIGAVLSDSILEAIENSRRTIMVVTPDYVENEWARFEYLFAQHETLKLKQRIIPIILGDLDKEKVATDKSLKHILSSIKCLRCPTSLTPMTPTDLSPGSARSPDPLVSTSTMLKEKLHQEKKEQKFWKRLELTMPKKKISDEESHDNMSTSTVCSHKVEPHHKDDNKPSHEIYDISDNFFSISNDKMFPFESADQISCNVFETINKNDKESHRHLQKNLLNIRLTEANSAFGNVNPSVTISDEEVPDSHPESYTQV